MICLVRKKKEGYFFGLIMYVRDVIVLGVKLSKKSGKRGMILITFVWWEILV